MEQNNDVRWAPIRKPDSARQDANLTDYESVRRRFDWAGARARLSGLPGGRGLNIAYEAVDRHARGPLAQMTALRWVDRHDQVTDISYAELAERTNRFANLLGTFGVQPGDRVFTLLGRIPELYVAALGTLKAGCVLAPLFSAFGPEPVRERMRLGEATVLVTTPELYRRKVAPVRDTLPALRHVLLVGDDPVPGTVELRAALAGCYLDLRRELGR